MIKKISKKLDFLMLQTRIRSLRKAKSAFPGKIDLKEIQQSEDYLRPFYTHYVKEISRADMAASLQLTALLHFFCRGAPKRKIVDFGSGFTSFVLRDCAKTDPSIKVWSVDDDAQWIEKTRDYLKYHRLNDNNLIMLGEFISSREADFDLALLDLNFVEVRKNYIKLAVERCKPEGLIVFDDVHKPEFMFEVLQQTRDLPIKLYDLKDLTLDQFGRYALLGIKD